MLLERGDVVAGLFEIERHVEAQGRIDCYRGRHLHTGKTVRIKHVRNPTESWAQPLIAATDRLLEASHEGLTLCVGAGAHGRKRWFCAHEWVNGASFDDGMSVVPVERVLAMGRKIAGALATLHELELVHGRVGPHQIVLPQRQPEAFKLLDGVHDPELPFLAAHAPYVAPEVVAGAGATSASDVYGLGVSLIRALRGGGWQLAEGRLGSFVATLFGVQPTFATSRPPLRNWLDRMIAFDPIQRPEARQVHAAFEAMIAGGEPPQLSPPPPAPYLEQGRAVAVVIARPPSTKTAKEAGLDAQWRHAVEAHGSRVVVLPDDTRVCILEQGNAAAIPHAAALVARTCHEHAFRASAIAGLLSDGRSAEPSKVVSEEIANLGAIASRTPAGVVRFSQRLAEQVKGTVPIKASGGSYVLATQPAAPRSRRGKHGTLELEINGAAPDPSPVSTRRRKTGEVQLEEPKLVRGKAGTLVMEPEPKKKGGTLELELPAEACPKRPEESPESRQPTLEIFLDPPTMGDLEPQPTVEVVVDAELLQLSKKSATTANEVINKRASLANQKVTKKVKPMR